MKTLAEISAVPPGELRPGTLRRRDLEAFSSVLEEVSACRVLQVTGAGEGKQTCALGLATAAALDGRSVALLECDLTNPLLAERLELSPAPGLHEYLRLEAEAGQILQPVVLGGPKSGKVTEPLVCIVAGKQTSQGPTLLASQDFRHATAKLRSAYDLVVLDGPSTESHAALLSNVATTTDALLCCVERTSSTRRSVRKLRRRLRRLPTKFAGFIACD